MPGTYKTNDCPAKILFWLCHSYYSNFLFSGLLTVFRSLTYLLDPRCSISLSLVVCDSFDANKMTSFGVR
jgi:hypothetical protein